MVAIPESSRSTGSRHHVQVERLPWAFFGCVLGFLAHFTRIGWAEILGRPLTDKVAGGLAAP
jgi:hypothetical protein